MYNKNPYNTKYHTKSNSPKKFLNFIFKFYSFIGQSAIFGIDNQAKPCYIFIDRRFYEKYR